MDKKMIVQDCGEVLENNYMPYAISVIVARSLPRIDGFKPSHRKLLYTMYKAMKLLDNGRTKCANIVGQTMKLNPHGDSSIYETLVRMTKNNESLLLPYIDSKGNFGKVYSRDMAFAHYRYTEAKLEKVTEELFGGIDENAVNMVDNYDGTLKEPEILPVSFPTILCNTTLGIAVGMGSNICSFNLKEVCDYTQKVINGEEVEDLIPDFSTGGEILLNQSDIKIMNESGNGSIKVRAKYKYDEKNNIIEIYEIPYTTTSEVIVEKIEELVKEKKLDNDILDVRDETDLKGLRIAIDVKKSTNVDLLMKKLFAMTTLQDNFTCNFNIITSENRPKKMGVKGIVDEWIKFRVDCLKRQYSFNVEKKKDQLHILNGLKIIIDNLDQAISIIRNSNTDAEAINGLKETFNLSNKQAEYIADLKLRRLNKEFLNNKISDIELLEKEVEWLNTLINDDELVKQEINKQLQLVSKKYGKPRMTTIIYDTDTTIPQDALIDDYNCQLVVTKEGYVKKTSKYSESQKLKDGDLVLSQTATTNKSKILFFTNKANVYFLNMYDLNDCLPSALGQYSYSLLPIEPDEKIIYTTTTTDYSGYMYFSFSNGKVCKVPLTSYQTKQNRSKLMNSYNTESPLVYVGHHATDVSFLSKSSDGFYFLASSSLISKKTKKNSIGVTFQKLHPDCKVVEFGINPLSELESRTCTYDSLANIGKKLNL